MARLNVWWKCARKTRIKYFKVAQQFQSGLGTGVLFSLFILQIISFFQLVWII